MTKRIKPPKGSSGKNLRRADRAVAQVREEKGEDGTWDDVKRVLVNSETGTELKDNETVDLRKYNRFHTVPVPVVEAQKVVALGPSALEAGSVDVNIDTDEVARSLGLDPGNPNVSAAVRERVEGLSKKNPNWVKDAIERETSRFEDPSDWSTTQLHRRAAELWAWLARMQDNVASRIGSPLAEFFEKAMPIAVRSTTYMRLCSRVEQSIFASAGLDPDEARVASRTPQVQAHEDGVIADFMRSAPAFWPERPPSPLTAYVICGEVGAGVPPNIAAEMSGGDVREQSFVTAIFVTPAVVLKILHTANRLADGSRTWFSTMGERDGARLNAPWNMRAFNAREVQGLHDLIASYRSVLLERDGDGPRVDRVRRSMRGANIHRNPPPRPLYLLELKTHVTHEAVSRVIPLPTQPRAPLDHRVDVRAHERVRARRGKHPVDPRVEATLRRRGYRISNALTLSQEDTDRLRSRGIALPAPGEWVAILVSWVDTFERGPEDAPKVVPMRVSSR